MAKLYEVAEPLPPHVRRATEQEVAWVRANAATLIERVDVPSDRYPKRRMLWPKSPLQARIVPADLYPLDAETGHDHDVRLDRFFVKVAPDGVVAWVPGMEGLGYFVGHYNSPFRDWIGGNLAIYPYIAFSNLREHFIYLTGRDDDLSVLGADNAVACLLGEEFGGARALRAAFLDWIGDSGGDAKEAAWKERTYLRRCGWVDDDVAESTVRASDRAFDRLT